MACNAAVRRLNNNDMISFQRLQHIAFSGSSSEESIRERIEKGEYSRDEYWGAVDGAGNVQSGMVIYQYLQYLDGHKASMAGVGGVASLPEIRRTGFIRKIFQNVFADCRERGTVLSYLYPFSHAYYKQFGYANCGFAFTYTLPTGAARKIETAGSVCEFKKDETEIKNKLSKVYEAHASRHNLMLCHDTVHFENFFEIEHLSPVHIYYWKNEADEIRSWVKYKKDGDKIFVEYIAWEDHEAMMGILQFLGMFEGAAGSICMNVKCSPEFLPELIWTDLYHISSERKCLGMARIMDAKAALGMMRAPCGEGKFTVRVTDKYADWNSGTYSVEFGGGQSRVSISSAEPDVDVTEEALAQLVFGVFDFATAEKYIKDIKVGGNRETLSKVFVKKQLLLNDYF
ncbi:MAG: GNAT family N-acetyltransferase [Defluviitaleaceae bacterium]|nr:GNAT family N-acetyltransferase [Defluviitaleaceae bacterium]